MYTLDASIIARSFDPADDAYVLCQELIDVLEQRAIPVIVPRLLLAEVAGVVRRLTRDPIRARLAVDVWRSYHHARCAVRRALLTPAQLIRARATPGPRAAPAAGPIALRRGRPGPWL